MGSYLSIHNDTSDSIWVKISDDEAAKRVASDVTAAVASASRGISGGQYVGPALVMAQYVHNTVDKIRDGLVTKGYTELSPGQSLKSNKLTLSLQQQCHVARARLADGNMVVEETYMRPIFTGAKDNSCKHYKVASWVKKHNYKVVEGEAADDLTRVINVNP